MTYTPILKCLKINSSAKLPKKNHDSGQFTDAAYDLFLPEDSTTLGIPPNTTIAIATGLKVVIPEGYWVKFHERSGLAFKQSISLMGGVIDSGYTGEWKVLLRNNSPYTQLLTSGQAIAQFTLEKVTEITIEEINDSFFILEEQKRTRKANGFGSSDKQ